MNETASLERQLTSEVGVAVDRVYMNAMYPERFAEDEASKLSRVLELTDGPAHAAVRAALSAAPAPRRRRSSSSSASSAARAPRSATLPFVFKPQPRRARRCARSSESRGLMPNVGDMLEGKRVAICAGSGGVGKTTTSAALAAGLAARGNKVAVLTIDPAKRLADSLGLEELGNEPSQVDPALFERAGIEMKGELWAMMLDAKATFDELVRKHAEDEETRDRILQNRIYRQISNALAGSQEYMAMEKLYEIDQEGAYDYLVLDTPPSRNALDFLDAPKRLTQFIEGREMQIFMKPTGLRHQGRRARQLDDVRRAEARHRASTCWPT